ncbi:hypothetical protein [Novosphingobium sp. Gsoil 351]|uniref:hypothetical protein n=1 Tax=Novosphingobium sp. Gsoil 351 TaxID=2675225 RepID=UPI0012B4E9E5|nr:hypothetical protein [Novosphingobium sp. Gsoil 351]QGN55687.1 hypothetical protein GKE62_15170 [Novosphingobium sp. Gsoil 351]
MAGKRCVEREVDLRRGKLREGSSGDRLNRRPERPAGDRCDGHTGPNALVRRVAPGAHFFDAEVLAVVVGENIRRGRNDCPVARIERSDDEVGIGEIVRNELQYIDEFGIGSRCLGARREGRKYGISIDAGTLEVRVTPAHELLERSPRRTAVEGARRVLGSKVVRNHTQQQCCGKATVSEPNEHWRRLTRICARRRADNAPSSDELRA